jgi:hypothetical protein
MARTMTDKRAAKQIADRLAKRDPADTDWRDGAPLRRIADAFATSVDAEAQLGSAIGLARAQGYSWASIGAVLGVSKQSAQRRYSHVPVPRECHSA